MGQGETITDGELRLMQAESRDRHSLNPVKKKRNRRSGLTYKKRFDRAAHDPLPDLMAEMVKEQAHKDRFYAAFEKNMAKTAPTVAQEVEIKPQIEIPTPTTAPEKTVYFAPKPKKEILKWERPIQRVPVMPDYSIKESFERPPATYTNIPSPYGLWTEMAADQLKRM